MGRPPHAHWDLMIIQPVIDPVLYVHQTLELHLVKENSTKDTILKGGDITNEEPMESRGPKVTGKVK